MNRPTLVAGVDSSTQSTKVLVVDAASGAVLREGRAAHPDGTEIDPEHWWQALLAASSGGLLEGVEAIGVAGQQHGMVALDEIGNVVRPALLWNDTRSADSADDLVGELGGGAAWADAVGSGEYVALGAARQAVGALAGDAQGASTAVRSAVDDVVCEPTHVDRGAEVRRHIARSGRRCTRRA